jgi:hypothetical protein
MSPDECRKAAKIVKDAWNFDLSVMRWTDPRSLNGPLTVRLVSPERMKEERGNARAYTPSDGKSFTMNLTLLDDGSGPRTCAHELGHAQADRVLHKRSVKHHVPLYFFEGHGLIMNRLYADHLGVSSPLDWQGNVRTVMSMSADKARMILFDNTYSNNEKDPKKTNEMECMGVYFVEYMRTRVQGSGIPDTVPKIGRVFELVGNGKTYGHAFKEVYGVWASQVASDIVELFKRTEANPAERYKGTRFEVAAQAVADKSRRKDDTEKY